MFQLARKSHARSITLVVCGIGALGLFGYWRTPSRDLPLPPAHAASLARDTQPQVSNVVVSTQQSVVADEAIDWMAAATGPDDEARLAAITALASLPKSQALPVLRRVLNAGTSEDRGLALNSLRTLALAQGDADGVIREILRNAVYDGGDEIVARDAPGILDEIQMQQSAL